MNGSKFRYKWSRIVPGRRYKYQFTERSRVHPLNMLHFITLLYKPHITIVALVRLYSQVDTFNVPFQVSRTHFEAVRAVAAVWANLTARVVESLIDS